MEIVSLYQTKNEGNLSTAILKKLFLSFKDSIQKLHNDKIKLSNFVRELSEQSKKYLLGIECHAESVVNGLNLDSSIKKMES